MREDDVAVEVGGLAAGTRSENAVLAVAGERVVRPGRARRCIPAVAPPVGIRRHPDEVRIDDRLQAGPARYRLRVEGRVGRIRLDGGGDRPEVRHGLLLLALVDRVEKIWERDRGDDPDDLDDYKELDQREALPALFPGSANRQHRRAPPSRSQRARTVPDRLVPAPVGTTVDIT